MSLPQSQLHYTIAEYRAQEREFEGCHEYLDRQIYELAGESEERGEICVNLVGGRKSDTGADRRDLLDCRAGRK